MTSRLIAVRLSPFGTELERTTVDLQGFRHAGRRGYFARLSFGPLRGGYEADLEGNFRPPLDNVSATSWRILPADLPLLKAAFEQWEETIRKKKRRALAR